MSVLLRQPHGFEGFRALEERRRMIFLSDPNRRRKWIAIFESAALADATPRAPNEDSVIGVDGARRFSMLSRFQAQRSARTANEASRPT